MGYINGTAREQVILFPEVLDDYIEETNTVRAVAAFVEYLDFKELEFVRAEPAETGRPGYDPRVMLGNIYLGTSEWTTVIAAAGAGVQAECGVAVVNGEIVSGLQDDRELSEE